MIGPILVVIVGALALMLWIIRRDTQTYARARRGKARSSRRFSRRLRRQEKDLRR